MIIIVPSRGRPQRAAAMVRSVRETAAGPVDVVVAIDPDDDVAAYRRAVGEVVVLPERVGYSATLNLVAAEADHDIYGAFGDDVLFRTPAWDKRVRETLVTPGIAYPNDLAHRAGWPTAIFMSRAIRDALGWLSLPTVRHQYADNAWWEIGREAGCLRYMDDVVCEHMHEVYGKAEQDETYREVYSEPWATESRLAWEAYREHRFPADVARVRMVL